MQNRNKRFYSIQVKNNLDTIIAKGAEINRKHILDAEEIDYKRTPTEIFSYDAFGFLDKYKDPEQIKKYIIINIIKKIIVKKF